MHVRIWGCRGSLATPSPDTGRYGGNTSCVEVRPADGGLLVLDSGTGVRRLGLSLEPEHPRTVHLLLTHMHLDHVEGLGFFRPLFDPETEIHVWGPAAPDRSLRDRIASYLSPPLFPLPFDTIPATFVFHEIDGADEWEIGGVAVSAATVVHPGPTLAFRLEEGGRSFAFIPDNEPALGVDLSSSSPNGVSGRTIAAGADVLFHDAQYTAEEYASRIGWGHSSLPDLAHFVRLAEPRRVVMFHHDPTHDDATLEQLHERAVELAGHDAPPLELAREGLELSP